MNIKSLEVTNIRSYKSSKITFEKGITFLKGDIGSGKSSLLQALEFALFGFKRGDLEGHHLLRKGEKSARVKLELVDEKINKDIIITRTIKKTKQGIVQDNGSIIKGESQEELSPTEITAHVFEFLGYPREFLTKDRNLLFRFSTYTPQEQLKEILYADNDKRLEIIRKLFSMDKYKKLDSGIQLFLKKQREKKLILKTRCENKDEIEKDLEKLNLETLNLEKQQQQFEKVSEPLQKKISKENEILEKVKNEYDELLKKELQVEKNKTLISQFEKRFDEIKTELKTKQDFLEETSQEKLELNELSLKKEISLLDKQKEKLEEQKTKQKKIDSEYSSKLQEKEKYVLLQNSEKEKISILKKELSKNDLVLLRCELKDLENVILKLELSKRKLEKLIDVNLISKKLKLQVNLASLKENIHTSKKQLIFLQEKNFCLHCNQNISKEHKEKELKRINLELKKNESILEKDEKQFLELLLKEKENTHSQEKQTEVMLTLSKESDNLIRLKKEYQSLNSLQKEIEEKLEAHKKRVNLYLENIEVLEKELKEKPKNNLESFEKELNELFDKEKELMINSQKNQHLLQSFEKIELEIKSLQNKSKQLETQILKKEKITIQSKKIKELKLLKNKKLESLKQSLLSLQEEKQKNSLEEQKLQLTLKEIDSQKEKLLLTQKKLDSFLKELKQIELNESFSLQKILPLCNEIEKTLFLSFYVEFSSMFQSIVRDLIEDQNLEIYLRDDFSIVVEQNGYDIDISNLSGGEKSSLAIAYRLALKHIIEKNIISETILHSLILDEPTDGFSNEQVTRLGSILKKSTFEQILLVSHDEKIESIADTVFSIEKKNHVSIVE